MPLSPPQRSFRGPLSVTMGAGFSEQGAHWQANDVSWMSHYTALHKHPVLHLL